MTGRTHDLAALTTLTFVIATQPLPTVSVATVFTAIGASMIGGIAPDLDQPTGKLWRKLPAGTLIGKILHPFFGAHRSISHSILGLAIFGILAQFILEYMRTFLLVDINIVWNAFMFGLISHLVLDTFTKEGVPWLFPIPYRFGIPPLKSLRITTGKLVETSFVFPLLLFSNLYLIYTNYGKFLDFIKNYIIR